MNHTRSIGKAVFEVALWVVASAFVLGVHAGTAAWILKTTPPKVVIEEAVQSAIMIEMAPEPEAIETEQQDIAPEDVPEEISNAQKPVEQDKSEDTPEKQPVEEPTEPEVVEAPVLDREPIKDPVETPVLETIETVAVPVPRPAPRAKTKINKKKKVRRKIKKRKINRRASAQAKAAIKARAHAKKSKRTAATQSSRGVFGSNMTPARWKARLMAHIERRKRFPSGANHRGGEIVYVRFRIDARGNVSSIRLARSSGYAKLDQTALDTVRRASPVPAPPPKVRRTITVPIIYNRR